MKPPPHFLSIREKMASGQIDFNKHACSVIIYFIVILLVFCLKNTKIKTGDHNYHTFIVFWLKIIYIQLINLIVTIFK